MKIERLAMYVCAQLLNARQQQISGSSSHTRHLSQGFDREDRVAELGDEADAAAIEADKHTLGNEEGADGCTVILKGGNNFVVIVDVNWSIFVGAGVAKLGEAEDTSGDEQG